MDYMNEWKDTLPHQVVSKKDKNCLIYEMYHSEDNIE